MSLSLSLSLSFSLSRTLSLCLSGSLTQCSRPSSSPAHTYRRAFNISTHAPSLYLISPSIEHSQTAARMILACGYPRWSSNTVMTCSYTHLKYSINSYGAIGIGSELNNGASGGPWFTQVKAGSSKLGSFSSFSLSFSFPVSVALMFPFSPLSVSLTDYQLTACCHITLFHFLPHIPSYLPLFLSLYISISLSECL